jgi:formate hydrogenlyase transcriptional activator
MGNIRELQNFIERSVILTAGHVHSPPLAGLKRSIASESSGPTTLEDAERDHIERLSIAPCGLSPDPTALLAG